MRIGAKGAVNCHSTPTQEQRMTRADQRPWRAILPPHAGTVTVKDEAGQARVGTLDALPILLEVPGTFGALLWQAANDLLLWSRTLPAEREGLFRPEAGVRWHAEALPCWRGIEALQSTYAGHALLLARPHKVTPRQVAGIAAGVREWAEGAGYPQTSQVYAVVAALADQVDPLQAYHCGVLHRRQAEHQRAESWFRWTIHLARRAQDWNAYALGLAGLGRLALDRGNLPRAERYFARRFVVVRDHKVPDMWGYALHDLMGMAILRGHARKADRLAYRAFNAYGQDREQRVRLANDIGYHWIEQGRGADAWLIFRHLPRSAFTPALRLAYTGNRTRAAGIIGRTDQVLYGAEEVRRMARNPAATEYAAEALLEVARGATLCGLWDLADVLTRDAQELAEARRHSRLVFGAEALREQIRTERHASTPSVPVQQTPCREAELIGSALAGV
jgi:hypothetical protein